MVITGFSLPLAASGERVALVIGNKDYAVKGLPDLDNTIHDAQDMKAALEQIGFEVIYRENADLMEMDGAAHEFRSKLTRNSIGLVYYSGHGVQADGENYLVPVRTQINNKAELKARAYNANIILGTMEEAQNPVNILILDACRDNPFKGFRGGARGLTTMTADSKGLLIAFATAPGKLSSDGNDRNGLYTKYLKRYITQPGLKIQDMFMKVRQAVVADSPEQIPWENSSLIGDLCLAGCNNPTPPAVEVTAVKPTPQPVPVKPAPAFDPASIELSFWDGIKNSDNPADFQAYLKKYPKGQFVDLARNRLRPKPTPAPVKPAPVPVVETPKPAPVATRQSFEPEMVAIKAGCFMMGSPASETGRNEDETQHQVCVKAFEMGKYEVTKAQFAAFVSDSNYQTEAETGNGCYGWTGSKWEKDKNFNWRSLGFEQGSNHPAVCVSWNDAQAYLNWLKTKTGKAYRLPTEAEWEYAARAGTTTAFYTGNCINTNQANYNGNYPYNNCGKGVYKQQTLAVGSYSANPWGLYDMAGNVWEWTCSDYAKNYNNGAESKCSNNGLVRIFRGGSWDDNARSLRSAYHAAYGPDECFSNLGLRFVLGL